MSSTNDKGEILPVVSEDTTEKEEEGTEVSDIFKLYHQCDLRLSLNIVLYCLIY